MILCLSGSIFCIEMSSTVNLEATSNSCCQQNLRQKKKTPKNFKTNQNKKIKIRWGAPFKMILLLFLLTLLIQIKKIS